MNKEFIKLLDDLARGYQNTPEGEEKERLKKIIDKAADYIYGKIDITELNVD